MDFDGQCTAQCMYLLFLHDTVLFGILFSILSVEHIGVVEDLELESGVVVTLLVHVDVEIELVVVANDEDAAMVMVVVTVDDVMVFVADTAMPTACTVGSTNQSGGNGRFATFIVGYCPGISLGGFFFSPRWYISRCEGSYCSLEKCPLQTCILPAFGK